jgi:hypothetical protein
VTRIRELGTTKAVTSTANVVLSSLILVTLMMMAMRSSEAFALSRATRRHFPEDGINRSLVLEVGTTKFYVLLLRLNHSIRTNCVEKWKHLSTETFGTIYCSD